MDAYLGPGASNVLIIVAGIIFAPYLYGPFLLYFRGSEPVLANWKFLNETDEPVGARSSELKTLGFKFAGYLQTRTGMRIGYFVHPRNKDSAEIILGLFSGRLDMLVFKTRFNDEFALEVGSSPNVPFRGAGNPRFHAFNFPQLTSTAVLYQVHLKLKEQYLDSRRPEIADSRAELFEFARKAEEVHAWRMLAWGLQLNRDRDRFVYTATGAIRAAWRTSWLTTALRKWWTLSQARRKMKELGITA